MGFFKWWWGKTDEMEKAIILYLSGIGFFIGSTIVMALIFGSAFALQYVLTLIALVVVSFIAFAIFKLARYYVNQRAAWHNELITALKKTDFDEDEKEAFHP